MKKPRKRKVEILAEHDVANRSFTVRLTEEPPLWSAEFETHGLRVMASGRTRGRAIRNARRKFAEMQETKENN